MVIASYNIYCAGLKHAKNLARSEWNELSLEQRHELCDASAGLRVTVELVLAKSASGKKRVLANVDGQKRGASGAQNE